MINIRGKFATYGEVWFDEDPPRQPSVDVLMFRQRPSPIDGRPCKPFLSLVNDLTLSEDVIRAAFGHTNRYEIKRAESKDGLETEFFIDPCAQLEEFSEYYDAFARLKGLSPAYRRGLAAACDAGQLVLSRASKQARSLVWHAYVKHGQKAALLHSASHFRNTQNSDTALLARANRWLHWRDMLRLKQLGVLQYDWGGIFEDESDPARAGINNFKRQFGGRSERTYNCHLPITMKGKAYLAVRNTLGRLKKI